MDRPLTVVEAVDHLSKMAEVDLKGDAFQEESDDGEINWVDPKHAEEHLDVIRESYRVISNYLRDLSDNEKERLKDPETQKGVQAIMLLSSEAAHKMDKLADRYQGQSISKLKEYKELQQFYLSTILPHFDLPQNLREDWQDAVPQMEDFDESQKQGIKDLDAVRKDGEYELFFIKKENGKTFFSRDLLRHLKLVGNSDELIESGDGDDPLLLVKKLQDRDVHEGGKEILRLSRPFIDDFYRMRREIKDNPFIESISKALMALMMTAHVDNLLENGSAKGCLWYYSDFHRYLRGALTTSQYQAFISSALETENQTTHLLLNLVHALCLFFFTRSASRKEAVDLIQKLIERGAKIHAEPEEPLVHYAFWKELLENDGQMRRLLKQYPSGPLLKTLDAMRNEEESEGFDPLLQFNFPGELFSFLLDDSHISALRIASPTHQEQIHEGRIVPEFVGFLHALAKERKHHLLINLQNRTSWEEFARAQALEDLPKRAEFANVLTIVTLPKNTDFYYQSQEYDSLHGALPFIDLLQSQVAGGKECGFYFPDSIKGLHLFVQRVAPLIHTIFFEKKELLSKQERLAFIEIFYQFLLLKVTELSGADTVSFTCKDAIDVGAAASAGFFAFIHHLSKGSKWNKEERNLLLWLLYHPALILRDRAIDLARFLRIAMSLDIFEQAEKLQPLLALFSFKTVKLA